METRYSVEYYEKNANQLDRKQGVIRPNEDLENKMSAFNKDSFSKQDWEKITYVMAKQVSEQLKEKLLEQKSLYMKVIKDGNCLGYTTKTQEIHEVHRIVTIFEYNCYKLAQFKKKYNIK